MTTIDRFHHLPAPRLHRYVEAAVHGELTRIAAHREGRNNALFRAAVRLYSLVQAGVLPETAITDALTAQAQHVGLPVSEIRATLRSAYRRATPAVLPQRNHLMVRQGTVLAPPPAMYTPSQAWQNAAQALVAWAQDQLWDPHNESGLEYLESRGLTPYTILNAKLGLLPRPFERSRQHWGLPPDDRMGDRLFLPAGIVIPYEDDHRAIVKLEIRAITTEARRPKYTVPGSANALWNARHITAHRPVMLLEGVFNALTVAQVARDLVTPVALGAATHARQLLWVARLSFAPALLIATDTGLAGEHAARYWQSIFPDAVRWPPEHDDPNAMLCAGRDVRAWVQAGLDKIGKVSYT